MGRIEDRLNALGRRMTDLSPLVERVRRRHLEGNRTAILAGQTPDGQTVAPLLPATIKRRKGTGPPRAPRRDASRVIADCRVDVTTAPGRLEVRKHWPGFDRAVAGMSRKRPTLGLRPQDVAADRDDLRRHIRGT